MRAFRPGLAPTILTVLALPVLLGLGLWQLERRAWKHELIAQIEENQAQTAVPLSAALALPAGRAAWRRIVTEGTYDNAKELHLFHTREGVPGFRIIVPFTLRDGTKQLVDRGFVPQTLKEPAARASGRVDGLTKIEAVLRPGAERGLFAAEDDPAQNRWYTADLVRLAGARGISPVPQFLLAATGEPPPGGWPAPLEARPELTDNHLAYALTWFSLAAVLLTVFVAWGFRRTDPAEAPPSQYL
jgi:surfeit locus 1 family protein